MTTKSWTGTAATVGRRDCIRPGQREASRSAAITPLRPANRPWAGVLNHDGDRPAGSARNRPKTGGKHLISAG